MSLINANSGVGSMPDNFSLNLMLYSILNADV